MAIRRTLLNGERDDYLRYRIAPKITPIIDPYAKAFLDPVPTSCMKTDSGFTGTIAMVCKPNRAWLNQEAKRQELPIIGPYPAPDGMKWTRVMCIQAPCPPMLTPIDATKWLTIKTPIGESIEVAVDENGDVVSVKEKPNWLPLAAAAGAAWFFLM